FEAALAARVEPTPPAQALANWITGELVRRLGDGEDPSASRVSARALAILVGLVSAKRVSAGAGRRVLDELVINGGEDPEAIVQAQGLAAIGSDNELAAIVASGLEANADAAQRVREGNAKAIGPIVGEVMRQTGGRADGGEVTRLVHEQLGV